MSASKRTPTQCWERSFDLGHVSGTTTTTTPITERLRSTQQSTAKRKESLVEHVNALSMCDFSERYFPKGPSTIDVIEPNSMLELQLGLTSWVEMSPRLRENCLELVEVTSSVHYLTSEMGWSRAKKLREMRHPAMKYLLLHQPKVDADDEFEGFASFMVTDEDGHEVIYCYEIHLQPELRGKAVGKQLMEAMEMIGTKVGLEKTMLTVFKSNEKAMTAYKRWGYVVDDFSPEPRTLRDGIRKEPSYTILSKKVLDLPKRRRIESLATGTSSES